MDYPQSSDLSQFVPDVTLLTVKIQTDYSPSLGIEVFDFRPENRGIDCSTCFVIGPMFVSLDSLNMLISTN